MRYLLISVLILASTAINAEDEDCPKAQASLESSRSVSSPFSYAMIRRDCAPWDGAAIGVYLTTSRQACSTLLHPYLSIEVYVDLHDLGGKTIKLGSMKTGQAARCMTPGKCEPAESGEVTFDTFGQKDDVAGHYTLKFRGGETERGAFKAQWCHSTPLCG